MSLTESDIPIAHPRRNSQMLESCKSCDFGAGENIPDDRCLANIVADDQPPSSALAHIVHRNEIDLVLMAGESTLHCQCVVMKAQDCRALRI